MNFTIRPIEIRDAKGLSELRRMPGVFENTLGLPSERLNRAEDFIANLDRNTHQFVAIVKDDSGEEKVIGAAGLTVSASPRMRHSGSIGISVHKDYQNQGVGSALMRTLLDIADNWLMLVRVELCVYADNTRAIHLYEKLGFKKEGIKRKAAIRNGEYVDEIMMARIKE
ncbi:GNAT family N-acetyltransferase [Lutispora thermophila]|nr:GNAT family N-acetyltransferase [Lutispora thermophila]